MRLSKFEQTMIKKVFLETFKEGKVYLFGSRVDDEKKGGDIDLLISPINKENLSHKKIDFLVALKSKIGIQKIDVVLDRGTESEIIKIALSTGVEL
jgi:predicted nucleotidyltransferase